MALFQYPKISHTRKLAPRLFKSYKTYKRYLQTEFARVCVYCRQPDSSAPNLNFGVDHYRPKGLPKFASLVCVYDNLYYCCGSCNSRKNNDWPADEAAGPYIVNPCDHVMTFHLRFDQKTGKVDPKTLDGIHTVDLLQLNDEALVKFRIGTLKTLDLISHEVSNLQHQLSGLVTRFDKGDITKHQYDAESLTITAAIAELRDISDGYTGSRALPALQKTRQGQTLVA